MGSAVLFPVFGWVYQALSAQGCLTAYEVLNEQMLVGLDGMEYFSSDAIHCWCEVTVLREADGHQRYHHAFVTLHPIDDATVAEIVTAARARWKSENENHNVLKPKGYHLEHNFGHGQHHLAMTLVTLNTLACLFHTVLHLVDASYQRIRQQRGTRKGFFQDIQTLTKYLLFDSWQHLIDFMLDDSTPVTTGNTS
jgi:hypothetical protein